MMHFVDALFIKIQGYLPFGNYHAGLIVYEIIRPQCISLAEGTA